MVRPLRLIVMAIACLSGITLLLVKTFLVLATTFLLMRMILLETLTLLMLRTKDKLALRFSVSISELVLSRLNLLAGRGNLELLSLTCLIATDLVLMLPTADSYWTNIFLLRVLRILMLRVGT